MDKSESYRDVRRGNMEIALDGLRGWDFLIRLASTLF